MNEIPKIISTKDLAYIEDMLNWNHTFIKLCMHLEECVEDSDILEFTEGIRNMHEDHYKRLLKLLK